MAITKPELRKTFLSRTEKVWTCKEIYEPISVTSVLSEGAGKTYCKKLVKGYANIILAQNNFKAMLWSTNKVSVNL